jgi:hypothetical protein
MAYASILLVVALGVIIAYLPLVRDFGQCDRICKIHHDKVGGMFSSRQIKGQWRLDDRRLCDCYEGASLLEEPLPRLYQEMERGYPYISRNKQVCGLKESDIPLSDWTSGLTYATKAAANDDGAKVANCGVCGRCSSSSCDHY